MAHEETSADVLNSIDSTSDNPIPVIYQSGYLTIKGYDREFETYRTGFPNREVEEGFVKYLMPFYANINAVESSLRFRSLSAKSVREIMILFSVVFRVSLQTLLMNWFAIWNCIIRMSSLSCSN